MPHDRDCYLPNPLAALCRAYGCDLAVPSVTGIGDILMYTPLVREVAMRLGRPVELLTGPIRPIDGVGTVQGEEAYPIWRANPFVGTIVDLETCPPDVSRQIHAAHEKHCHFGHVIENICAEYGIVPQAIRPDLYLTETECRAALALLADLPRPILCIHPHGTSSPGPAHPWHTDEWRALIAGLPAGMTVLEVGMSGREEKDLPTRRFRTTLREMMALVWASDLVVGFDSSVAHVATAFSKPTLVLWEPVQKAQIDLVEQPGLGAAAITRWGYSQNRNLVLLNDIHHDIRRLVAEWIATRLRAGRFP
ncbi:hypothetical protein AVM11_11960 [Sphingomonas melonis TY]|uniref:Uncharacterized protein n=1 Tax=Sphingomonas melonis TY TaxID=621456 RepID=A0A175XZC3_9SPHN|nr:glycosyltransferase family 9 protein [Sphingomonas melonis]KZB93575.1 hypothetical protein AVM11_11960 [Sphingomonas melonis TY]